MRQRILAAIVGVATVAVMVFAVPLGATVRNLTIQDELHEIEHAAERVGRAVEPENVAPGVATDVRNLAPKEFAVGLYDRAGHLVGGSGPRSLEPELRGALSGNITTRSGASLRVAVPIGVRPTTGAVRATATSTNVNSRVRRAWTLLGGFALLAIATAAALAWWLSRQLDAPLLRLAAAAHRVGDGDFTSRAPRSGVIEIDGVAEAIDATAERLGAALDRERSFSSDVSHQLRTRVAGLRITLEAAVLTPTSEHEAIQQAIEETDRLESTIVELLTLARDNRSNIPPVDLVALFDEIQAGWRTRLAEAARPLRVEVEPGLLEPRVSAIAIRHIIDVLVDNAYRHARGEIRVTARSSRDGIAIDVHDEGPGITRAPDELFLRRATGPDGHGIGLALARSLAEAEGCRLVVTRRLPGAQFTLTIPLSPITTSPD
jgi:signal transduction histidine kinase